MNKLISITFLLVIVLSVLAWGFLRTPKQSVESPSRYSSSPNNPVQLNTKSNPVMLNTEENPDFDLSIDPLISDELGVPSADENPVQQEAYLVAQITAHLNDVQLMKFRALRKGKKVRSAAGVLILPYEPQEQCTNSSDCSDVIVNGQSGEVVWDGKWQHGFIETGVGQEVVAGAAQ